MKMKFNPKRLCPKILLRPLCFLLILGFFGFLTVKLWLMTKQTENHIYGEQNSSFSEIESTAKLLHPLNSSAIHLARSLSLLLNGTQLSFTSIATQVAPTLFLALTTIAHATQVSYVGLDGLLFSYYKYDHQTLAVYANTSFSPYWYTQPVNRDTGKLYGDAVVSKALISVNESWFQEALNNTSGYSSIGRGWNKDQGSLFHNTIAMDGRGLISLSFPTRVINDHFAALDFRGGFFYLATADGRVIVQTKLQNTRIVINNRTLLVQTLNHNGVPEGPVAQHSCMPQPESGKRPSFFWRIMGVKYKFFCSTVEIAGVELVYVLAYCRGGVVSLVRKNSNITFLLLVIMYATLMASLGLFIFLIAKAAKREMFLCAALIKQMNATQQAERKSMNKTFALANASHDVRASLAAITGLAELCYDEANPESEIAANLDQIKTCTKDLLGILNSVLEMSKIEAGKMELEEEEFNLAQLLEEVVNMYYNVGIKKGVDVVLDPSDGSILGTCLVKGDRVKLKQILCNLMSNAIKFTSEGHVVIRAAVKKKSFRKDIIASNRNILLKCLSSSFFKNKDCFNDLNTLHSVEQDPKMMEFEFEVDDTGKGIPKDKKYSVFEEFVQVKETALGQEGTGLGLGIVQSIVHLMKGEITIVEKEPGERGTCFKFNVLLTICEPECADTERRTHNDWSQTGFHQHFASFWNPAPKPEGSHMILFIAGEERRRVLKRYIENNLNIKVTIVKQEKNLHSELRKVKRKMDPSFFTSHSGKSDSSIIDYLTKSGSSNSDTGAANEGIVKDGNDNVLPQYRKTNSKGSSSFTLVVIDASAGTSLSELYKILANFRKDIPSLLCKVVWLHNPIIRNSHVSEREEDPLVHSPCDHVIHKPFHGSRLIEVLKLLPECSRGTSQSNLPKLKIGTTSQEIQHSVDPNPSSGAEMGSFLSQYNSSHQKKVINNDGKRSEKPLNGKKVLIVEDTQMLLRLNTTSLTKLGANVDSCTNGKEAFDHICKVLSNGKKEGHSKLLPYDYILMDCNMPVMDGYEATRLIRKEEQRYGLHIPIVALTAHAMAEEARKIAEAGMDFHLTKPLQVDELLLVFQAIDEKWKNA